MNLPSTSMTKDRSQRAWLQQLLLTLMALLCLSQAAITPTTLTTFKEIEIAAVTSILEELPSLRGSFESSQLKLIRDKLRSLKEGTETISASTSLRQLNGELPPVRPSWQSQWSSLSDDELSVLSHDSSFLKKRQQRFLNAAYLSRRRTSVTVTAIHTGALLRGGQSLDSDDRNLASWTTHGDVSEVPGTIIDGEVVFNKPENHESVQQENSEFLLMGYDTTSSVQEADKNAEDDKYIQDLYNRLHDAMEVTKRLDANYAHYDTNSEWTYSNPPPQSNLDDGLDEMVQHSALDSDRQRLLTGSYAVWQWYDRNNLASPGNMDFKKLSRVNYAFFQTDGDGFIFGTDSWADPNVLFGPYDFSINADKLPPECKGGRGRDDGKPKNATVDEFAIYTQQPLSNGGNQQQQKPQQSANNAGNSGGNVAGSTESGDNTNNSTRRTQGAQNTNTDGGKNTNSFKYPDFTKDPVCKFFEQCHRNFPNSKTCNTHKFKEGLIHIAHKDGAQVYPSIGGWTLSNSFPAVAADPKKRLRFARECVGLIADYGFDGIDIDWEYPGYEPHGGSAQDRKNFNELLLAIRVALNEYQEQTGDAPIGGGAFGLTAALPCGPANINFLDVSFLSGVLNGMNLMTFDFHNEQEPITGVASPLYDQGWGEKGLSVDGCVKNYYKAGAGNVANKISIGVPFYGKTYSYASDLNAPHSNTNGLFGGNVDQANWPQDLGTPVFYNMLDTMVKGSMVCKRHEPTKSAYAYFKDGSGLVTYDDPQAVCDKAEYVNQNLLGGLFIWELSGDLSDTLTTPLLDAINRKLEELNFDCARLKMEEDCSLIELPPPAAKGADQIESEDITNMTEAILEHLQKAEAGQLTSAGRGYGALTRAAFMMRAYDGSLFPSYTFRFDHFVDAFAIMAETGVDGDTFYLGESSQDKTGRILQSQNSTKKSTSLVYGLVNIAAFLAQAMTESIIHDACDELNVQPLPNSTDDGIGLDDGHDHFRFPVSNACGQNGRSYQDEQCKRAEDKMYDCATQLNSEEFASMEVTAFSRSRWPGSPGPLYCAPKSVYETTGFWNAAVGKENDTIPLANDDGRTDVESCCFWGRGCLLSVKGTCLLGKLNYHLGANKAKRDGASKAMFPDVDFCRDPGEICAGMHSTKLRWIVGFYHWIENVQSYNEDGFNFMAELNNFVDENLEDENFLLMVTRIHLFGCHLSSCSDEIPDMDARIRNFEKVLSALNLQFTSFAKAEPPFETFEGQVPPTKPPVQDAATKPPTGSPITTIENVEAQVRMYLTGVPPDKNMSSSELKIFDNLMLELLVPRLQTAGVDVSAVKVVQQNTETDFVADSNFNSQASNGDEAVLELILNVTLSYYPPEPDGWREWSIYLKAWIESFGSTMVDIFTSPKNPQHPDTNSKFWDDLSDVSAANIPPGGLQPKEIPTPPPTYIVIPEQTAANKAILGMGIGVGSIAFFIFLFFGCYIHRKFKQEKTRSQKKEFLNDDDISYGFSSRASSYGMRSQPSRYSRASRSRGNEYNRRVYDKLLDGIQEGSSESESSSDSSSSESSSDSSDEGSSSSNSSSSSSSEEPVRKQMSAIKTAHSQAQTSTVSPNTASKSQSSASFVSDYESRSQLDANSFVSGYESRSQSDTKSFVSGRANKSQADSKSFASDDVESRGESESMSYSQATTSMASIDADGEEYLEIVRRAADNDHAMKIISLDNKKTIGHNDDGERLWSALATNQFVECLSLRNSNLNDAQVSALSVALMDNRIISRIWLENNDISSEGAEYLLSVIESNNRITELRLDGNLSIDPQLLDDINSILEGASVVTDGEDNLGFVVDQIINNDPSLRDINLSGMNVGGRPDALFDALTGNTYVRSMDLSSNEIDDDCISSLSIALMENSSIVHLNLSDNFLTSEGAEYLIGLLDTNTTIMSIDLSNNDIGDSVLREIDDILVARRQIPSSSSVASSLVAESQLAGIVERLKSNDRSMTELCLDNIDLTNCPETEDMIDALIGNNAVTKLSLVNTCFDDGLAASLSLSLVDNTTITHIILRNNHMTDEGCDYLLGTLDSNTTLLHLDLEENYIDDKLLDEIDAILSERRSMSYAGQSSRASQSVDGSMYSTASYSSASASISMASRVSSVASSFMSRRSSSKQRDKKASAKIAGKEIV